MVAVSLILMAACSAVRAVWHAGSERGQRGLLGGEDGGRRRLLRELKSSSLVSLATWLATIWAGVGGVGCSDMRRVG